jgi:Flp pilus assembly protein TadD
MRVLSTYRFSGIFFSARDFYKYALLFFTVVCFMPSLVYAAADSDDSPSDSIISSYDINKIRDMIDDSDAQNAIDRLKTLAGEEDESADVWNLLGYAYRKQGQNEQSADAYRTALELDPVHKGALEYQGELFLVLGDTEGVEGNLKMLQLLCPEGCHELDDLQEAIDAAR